MITHIRKNQIEVGFSTQTLCGKWKGLHEVWADPNYTDYPERETCVDCLNIYTQPKQQGDTK